MTTTDPKPAEGEIDWTQADRAMTFAASRLPNGTVAVGSNEGRAYLALKTENERLGAVEARHNRLCLADLGGDGVWPCGCHHLIVDSYGSRKLLTEADGETHRECDDHTEVRAERDALKSKVEQYEEAILTWNGPELCALKCECGYGCPHGDGCMNECDCSMTLRGAAELSEVAQTILAKRKEGGA